MGCGLVGLLMLSGEGPPTLYHGRLPSGWQIYDPGHRKPSVRPSPDDFEAATIMDDARHIDPSDIGEPGSAVLVPRKPIPPPPEPFPPPRMGEERDDYPAVVATLNARWRVIDSKCGIQWILQRLQGKSHSWRGNAFCRTRDGLLSNISERCADAEEAGLRTVEQLPARRT